ncbi:unnamed protein product [Acidocella sp. C78]|uniref:SDR family NAD(P)-dependent oxidoreductase n=1 Tax=Acidocella sp. C78 TaxID=1671486 RepID=UPI001BC0EA26|nr:SDR family NAD(P)-dependent oxidoreductase [Acidocella sp. C78]CAG4921316.1 unnamed protein product [Acidocella sp. C78]
MTATLLIAGLGYTGRAVAIAAREAGFAVIATARDPAGRSAPEGVALIPFAAAAAALPEATHLLLTAAPGEAGDPLLALCAEAIAAAPALRWIGYFSTTGVYGDRQGGTVDEATPPAPGSPRTRRRIEAEQSWAALANDHRAVDIIRLAGIYGPGRSAFDDLRAGTARRIDRPAQKFSRIHVDDIAGGTLAAIATATGGVRILTSPITNRPRAPMSSPMPRPCSASPRRRRSPSTRRGGRCRRWRCPSGRKTASCGARAPGRRCAAPGVFPPTARASKPSSRRKPGPDGLKGRSALTWAGKPPVPHQDGRSRITSRRGRGSG